MGEELGVTREWISKLENCREDFSELIILKLKALQHGGSPLAAREGASLFGGPAQPAATLIDELDETYQMIIASAAGDPGRLGWIREQLAVHLAIPSHWKEKVRKPRHPSSLSPSDSSVVRAVITRDGRQGKSGT